MRAVLMLWMATLAVWADASAQILVRNPAEFSRTEVVTVRLRDLDLQLPLQGSLEVRDARNRTLKCQLDDLDLSNSVTGPDALCFEVRLAPYETSALTIGPGIGARSIAQRVPPGDVDLRTAAYSLHLIAAGGWLSELRGADGNLVANGLYLSLVDGGIEPPIQFDQRGLKATIVRCQGPLRETVFAQYDLDDGPFRGEPLMGLVGELRPGYRGEVLYGAYADHLSVTHTVLAKDSSLPLERCLVTLSLPLPKREPTVLNRWSCPAGDGVIPGEADRKARGWATRPPVAEARWIDFSGPQSALAVIPDLRTDAAVQFSDSREEQRSAGDRLSYVRYLDSVTSTLYLVPHAPKSRPTGLLQRLSAPLEISGLEPPLPALQKARSALQTATDSLREASRTEAFITPADLQVHAATNLLAMAQLCARNERLTQATRLAQEAANRAEAATAFLQGTSENELRAPAPARLGTLLVGVRLGSGPRSVGTGWDRCLAALRSFGITNIADDNLLSWRACEPSPEQFDLTQADDFLDRLERAGMRLLPGIDPWSAAPSWVKPEDDLPALIERYCEELLPHLKGRDAVLGWRMTTAPGGLWGPNSGDPTPRFREWLRKRYVNLLALNAAWGTNYTSLDQMQFPAYPPAPTLTVGQELPAEAAATAPASTTATTPTALTNQAILDLNRFLAEDITSRLGRLTAFAQKLDPGRPAVVTCPDAQAGFASPAAGDPWSLRDVSRGAYCHSFQFSYDLGTVGGGFGDYRLAWPFGVAVEKSALGDRPIWCTDFAQNWWQRPLRLASRADVRLTTWMAVAEGLRGVFAAEVPGGRWSAANFDNSPLPVLEEFGVLSAQLQALGPYLGEATPWPAEVAIYWPTDSLARQSGGRSSVDPRDPQGPRARLRSLWQALSVGENYPVRFLEDSAVLGDELKGYKALVLTETLCLSEEVAKRLATFVKDGGMLVLLGPTGAFDTQGTPCVPAPTTSLRDLIGARLKVVREAELTVARQPITRKTPLACYAPVASDLKVLAKDPETGDLLAFSRDVGRGQVLVVGASLGVATDTPTGAGRRWLAEQLGRRGIYPPIVDSAAPTELPSVYARLFTHGEREHLLVANLTAQDLPLTLTLAGSVRVSDKPYDLLTGTPCPRRSPHSLFAPIPAGEVLWICL
jgi:hypothetical protein